MMQDRVLKVLFLCTGNSCRSQMAEGWAQALKSDAVEAYSAGVETHGLNRMAVEVMAEAGVDISRHTSKHVDTLRNTDFDAVITVCDNARETCPIFPAGKMMLHVGFADPPAMAKKLAAQGASEEEQRDCYRKVRDEIRALVETFPDSLYLEENDK